MENTFGRRFNGWFADRSTTNETKTNNLLCGKMRNAAALGWNIRSLKVNTYALTKDINAKRLQIVILVETWLKEGEIESLSKKVPILKWWHTECHRNEGVIIGINALVKSNIEFAVESWLLGIRVKPDAAKEILIVGCYITQINKKDRIKSLFEIVSHWLLINHFTKTPQILLFGDFNNSLDDAVLNKLKKLGINKVDMGITREASNGKLDFYLTNLKWDHECSLKIQGSNSDHNGCYLKVSAGRIGLLPAVPKVWARRKICNNIDMLLRKWNPHYPLLFGKEKMGYFHVKRSPVLMEVLKNRGEIVTRGLITPNSEGKELKNILQGFKWFKNRNVEFKKGRNVIGIETNSEIIPIQNGESIIAQYLTELYRSDTTYESESVVNFKKNDIELYLNSAIAMVGQSKKALGCDGLPPEAMNASCKDPKQKAIQAARISKIKEILLEWLTTGTLPQYVMDTRVHLLAKKECITKLDDIRTIAISSPLLKVIEIVLLNGLKQVWSNDIVPEQIGFRTGKGTTPGSIRLLNWLKNWKKGYLVVFLDLKKAFDSVKWNVLKQKLIAIKVDSQYIKWIMHIISHITMWVGDSVVRREKGVPQGSILSPTLFDIYINDLVKKIKQIGDVVAYADDIATYIKVNRAQSLWEILQNSQLEGLSTNVSKSNYLLIHGIRNPFFEHKGILGIAHYKHLGLEIYTTIKATGRQFLKQIKCRIRELSKKSKRMPTAVKEIVMNAWALGPINSYVPALFANRAITEYEIEGIYSYAYKQITGLPMWTDREWVLRWLIKDKCWKEYTFNALCKVDQIDEALSIYCDNGWNLLSESTHGNALLLPLRKLIHRTSCPVFGLYLGLHECGNWYGFADKRFFFLICNSCGVAWNGVHAIYHHLIEEEFSKRSMTLLLIESQAKDYRPIYKKLCDAACKWLNIYKDISATLLHRRYTGPNK